MLPPTIPTSFVPRAPSTGGQRTRADFAGAFSYFCYAVLVIAFVLATGVFLYEQVLKKTLASDDTKLFEATKGIDASTVDGFIRLRDRLTTSNKLINSHVAFTGFFSALERLLPSSVRFSSLHLSVGSSGEYAVEGTGVAKSFNALAAASTVLSSEGRIKRAIFSQIGVNKDSSVTFSLSAVLDPKLVAFVLDAPPSQSQASSTTPLP